MTDREIKSLVSREISAAQIYDSTELREKRERALNYYNGEMPDTPHNKHRSKMTSRDVSDVIGWILPSLMRVFTSGESLGRFDPVNEGDEAGAQQATEYINYKLWKDHDGYRIIWDACHDALLLQNGILKHWWDDSKECEYSTHTGLFEDQVTLLMSEEGVEVKAATQNDDGTYDLKIERTQTTGRLRLDVVAPENFLIDDASEYVSEEETRFCAERREITRSELVKMGFDRDKVDKIPTFSTDTTNAQIDDARKDDFNEELNDTSDRSMQIVEVFECYILADVDNDGIAERIRCYVGGGGENGTLIDWDVWDDDLPFTDLVASRVPHRWEGRSIADETMDIQQVKTVLTRQSLDNIYAHNNPQREVEQGSIVNPDQLTSPQFNGVIQTKKGSKPIINHVIPFTADKSLGALAYFDSVVERRTGVSKSTMALDPSALQNQTATAVNAQRDSSYSKVELIARNMAEMGWKRFFKMMLRLYVKHQDKPDIVRLRDEWVPIDPRHWNANMDVTIDIGLGTGSRDRDVATLGDVLAKQIMVTDRLTENGFSEQALDMLPKIQRTLVKQAESAGLKNPEEYFPEVSDEMLIGMKKQAAEQKSSNPDADKVKAEMAMQQQKMQAEMAMQKQKMEMDFKLKEAQFAAEIKLKEQQMIAEFRLKEQQQDMGQKTGAGLQAVRFGGNVG